MANITTTGTTSYPAAIDTRTTLTDGAAGDVIVANHPNGLGAALLAVQTELGVNPAGSVADVAARLNVSQNADGTLLSSIVAAGGGAAVSYSSGVFTVSWSPDGPGFIQNLGLEVTANAAVANQLRIRLVQRSGATPTSASPIRMAFKVATASSGPSNAAYVVREVTSDTPLLLTSGSSLGTFANERARIYVAAIDNNGTVEAAAYNPKQIVASVTAARVTNLFRPSEVATYTTTAEGGAGGADSAATLYSTSARTGVYLRRLGYFDITMDSTVGNWANNPNGLTVIGPGVPVTGDVIQTVATTTGQMTTGTTTTPVDGTLPQISEGDPKLWATMTHSAVVNPVLIEHMGVYANSSAGGYASGHVHRNSETDPLFSASNFMSTANTGMVLAMANMIATTTNGATGYYLIVGGAAGTTTFNGEGGAGRFGGSMMSFLRISEVCA